MMHFQLWGPKAAVIVRPIPRVVRPILIRSASV